MVPIVRLLGSQAGQWPPALQTGVLRTERPIATFLSNPLYSFILNTYEIAFLNEILSSSDALVLRSGAVSGFNRTNVRRLSFLCCSDDRISLSIDFLR